MNGIPKKKRSSASVGNYYKLKTKKWFRDQGFFCEYLEQNQRIYVQGRVIFIKRDLAGADGFAMNGKQIIFWQSKLSTNNIAQAIKEFYKYPYPPCVDRWVIVWTKGCGAPNIQEVK